MNSSTTNSTNVFPHLPKFDGKDYPVWKAQMAVLLNMHGLSNYIQKPLSTLGLDEPSSSNQNGSDEKRATEQSLAKANEQENQSKATKAFGFILFSLSKDQTRLFMDVIASGSAYDLWNSLSERYERKTVASKADTMNALYECKMAKNESFDVYVSRIKALVMRLKGMEENCSNDQILYILFKGLPLEYEPIIQALKIREKLTFEHACSHIRDSQESIKSKESESGNAHYTNGSGSTKPKFKYKQNKCFTCKEQGHIAYDCPKNKDAKKCSYCKYIGHSREECPRIKNDGKDKKPVVSMMVTTSSLAVKIKSNDLPKATGNSATINQSKFRSSWILDSGATHHLSNNRDQMTDRRRLLHGEIIQLTTASGQVLLIEEIGNVKFIAKHNGQEVIIKDVCYVPNLAANLISVAKITNSNAQIRFRASAATLIQNGEEVLDIPKQGDLYILEQQTAINLAANAMPTQASNSITELTESTLWHNRLGHLSYSSIQKLINAKCVNGLKSLKINSKSNKSLCEGCIYGKAHRESFGQTVSTEYQAKEIMDRVHADLYGPININSEGDTTAILYGAKYLLLLIDEKSRMMFGYILQSKSDAEENIISWCNQAMVQTGKPLKEFHSDGGGEFSSKRLLQYFKDKGIKRTITNKGTPQHNGIAERANRTVNEMATSMLHHSKLSQMFWPDAVLTAIYNRNRNMNSGNKINKTSEEIFTGIKPDLSHLKVFGCNAYIHTQKEDRENKFSAKAKPGIFLGYSNEKIGYRIFNLESKSVEVSRDIQFDENKFTHGIQYSEYFKADQPVLNNEMEEAIPIPVELGNEEKKEQSANEYTVISSDDLDHVQENESRRDHQLNENQNRSNADIDQPDSDSESVNSTNEESKAEVINTNRPYKQYMNSEDPKELIIEGKRNRRPVNSSTPMYSGDPLKVLLSYAFSALCSSIVTGEPLTYEQAIESKESIQWKEAMNAEYNSLLENNTWTLTELPEDCKPIGCKWVYKKKFKSDGSIERFKARLVAQGFSQQEGIDYNETFAPVVKYKSLRILLAIVANLDLELHQLDVETAFLNASIQETVYMKQPKGFFKGNKNQQLVCKLNKTLYGTKQASREWNNNLNDFLVNELGFKRCLSDTCVYVRKSQTNNIMILIIFVDDIISAFNSIDMKEWLRYKGQLSQKYKIRDLGEVEWILQMKVTRDRIKRTLILDQERYIEKVLSQFNMTQCKELDTPASPERLTDEDSPTTIEEQMIMKDKPYMNLVGSILYAAITTRPDIAFAVNLVSRFMQNPGEIHWKACKRILRYLSGTRKTGLIFRGNNPKEFEITAYSDADWAGDQNDRKSTTGFVITINGSVVSWLSKKQPTVALSTAEAEYMAISATIQEVNWISQLLSELDLNVKSTAKLFCDNQAAIAISTNDINHSRTKHIDIRHHYIRDAIKNKQIDLAWISTDKQMADILTKPLSRIQFSKHRDTLMHVEQNA
jgi:hypothetical protein